MISVDLSALPSASFAPQDASETERGIITAYEAISRTTLQPGDPVRLFLESLAYILSVQNGLIDLAGKQNLLAYAQGAHLDHLGALMGVYRIPAQPARCMVRFSLASPLGFEVPVPQGTRVTTQSGKPLFATSAPAAIAVGATFADVPVTAATAGAEGNGLLPGQIAALVDPLPYIAEVRNTTLTLSGADIEGDGRLRERIRMAPETYTNAGSEGAYRARTLAVSQEILAVAVHSPTPGVVDVRFVLTGGELPDEAMIALVKQDLSGETVRPLTDEVRVGAPDAVEYAIRGKWFLRRSDATLTAGITGAVAQAVETYRLWKRSQPGRDINPTRLASLMERAGAKRVELESPAFAALSPIQIARETAVEMRFGGVEDD